MFRDLFCVLFRVLLGVSRSCMLMFRVLLRALLCVLFRALLRALLCVYQSLKAAATVVEGLNFVCL